MQIRALIVDDEPLARARLQRLLQGIADVEVVGSARNGREAIEMQAALTPNLILMDINMPGVNGLDACAEILEKCEGADGAVVPSIVFCTAYDLHAVKAFELNASAYLLKPISSQDLQVAIARAGQLNQLQLEAVKQQFVSSSLSLSIQIDGAIEKVPIERISYFRSEGKHVVAGLEDGNEIFVDYTLKDLESRFVSEFQRVHRSVIVNQQHAVKLQRSDAGAAVIELLPTGKRFIVSRRLLSEVKKCFLL